MLEEVGVDLSGLNRFVRGDVVVEFYDFKGDALFREVVRDQGEYVRMGFRRGSDRKYGRVFFRAAGKNRGGSGACE